MAYKIGDNVTTKYKPNPDMIVTAIMLKGKNYKKYECSFADHNGNSTSNWFEWAELTPYHETEIGFKKHG